MLIRIVRMTFKEDEVDSFVRLFKENKAKIRSFPGCQHLELHKDYHEDHIFITYSHWDDETVLDTYRHSELFKNVWSATKPLFADKPIAYSQVRCEM